MDSRPGISVVINTLNEEANIGACIQNVQEVADEIVVCDMHSDDRTAEIAQSLGARVVLIDRIEGQYQRMRYLGIKAAAHEWILQIDADERLNENLRRRLRDVANNTSADLVCFGILFWYFGGWVRHGGFFLKKSPRLFRREVFLSRYHNDPVQAHQDWAALNGVAHTLQLPAEECHLLHLAYPTIEKYVCKTLGIYARIEAEQYFKQGRRFSLLRLVGDPVFQATYRFLWHQGYRDGIRGFILAVLYAGYRFTTWANLWLLEELDRQKGSPNPA